MGIGVVLLALAYAPMLPSLLERRRRRKLGNHFVGEGGHRSLEAKPAEASRAVPMATYAEVKREYERRHEIWLRSQYQVEARRGELVQMDYQNMPAVDLLKHATDEERGNIAVILGIGTEADPAAIVDALRKAGSHGLMSAMRGGHVPYEEVVKDVARKLGAKGSSQSNSAAELERQAVGAAMEHMLAKASPEGRKAMLAELARGQATSSTGLITATGGLVLANLSGFGLYLAASSSLAAITGAVGLTLPFAVYTGLSSALGVVTGPVGWAALALAAIVKFGGAEYRKTVPGVIAVASCRARLIAAREEEMEKLHKRQVVLEEGSRRLSVLAAFVAEMERVGTERSVPRTSVPW